MRDRLKKLMKANDAKGVRNYLERNMEDLECTEGNYTPLIYAAFNGYLSSVKVLVDMGANLDYKDKDGTPLENAMKEGHTACVEVLLKANSSVKDLSNGHIGRYEDLLEKYRPDFWEQVKLKRKFAPYDLVNDFIVMKREGKIKGLGEIHTMFNFRAQTVTEIINDNPGFPRDFDKFKQNRVEEIITAYEFIKAEGKKVEPPIKRVEKVKLP